MNGKLLLVLLTSIFLHSHSKLHAQDINKKYDLIKMYETILKEKGYENVHIDSDLDLQFEYKGDKYYVGVYAGGKTNFNLVCFNHAKVNYDLPTKEAYRVCAEVSAESPLVKAYISDSDIWFTCELMFSDPKELLVHFTKYLDDIEAAMKLFDSKYTSN